MNKSILTLINKKPPVIKTPYSMEWGSFTAVKSVVSADSVSSPGEKYVAINTNSDSFTCREEFHKYLFGSASQFIFWHEKEQGAALKAFLDEAETRLGIPEKSKTKVYTSSVGKGSLIIPSPFWRAEKMRKELFSILLRAGCAYKGKKSFWATVLSDEYAAETETAVRKFFKGFTHFKGKKSSNFGEGWHWAFAEMGMADSLTIPKKPIVERVLEKAKKFVP